MGFVSPCGAFWVGAGLAGRNFCFAWAVGGGGEGELAGLRFGFYLLHSLVSR